MHHPTDRIINTMAFVTPVVEHWLERDILREEYLTMLCVAHAGKEGMEGGRKEENDLFNDTLNTFIYSYML